MANNRNRSYRGGSLEPMDAEQLRQCAHQMVDFIADYYKTIEEFPVLSPVEPGYLSKLLPNSTPHHPASLEDILNDVRTLIFPGVTHWQSPNYFAYFPSNSSIAGFLGEMLSAGINMVGFSWITSPAATELEIIVLDWLAKILNLPEEFLSSGNGGGVIQGTASEAILVSLIAARDKVLRTVGNESLGTLVAYGSDQTHCSLKKACQISGIRHCRALKTDSSTNHSLSAEHLASVVSRDVAAGLVPFFVCGTVGCTSTGAVDPLESIGQVAKLNSMWFHVDAAYAGAACVCPEFRHLLNGVESAHSFNMNAHKWMLTNFDCSALWVKERGDLVQSLSTNPEYLSNKASEERSVVDFKDWQIPLGRRFRSLKLWMVLRMYGADGLQGFVRKCVALAKRFERHVEEDVRFQVSAPVVFSLVCFRLRAPRGDDSGENETNRKLLDAVNSSGKAFLSHTVMDGIYMLRFVVGAPLTEEKHVDSAWSVITEVASALLGKLEA